MGIIFSNAVLMAKAKRSGVCFDEILTIGHQSLYLLPRQIKQLAKRYGLNANISVSLISGYANEFLKTLFGAKNVMSLDYSDYEDCDIIHDMNHPIDPRYHEKFDVVIDGGSLEHIFNFPIAIANCMNMLRKGGSLFIFTNANNHTGHGFFQFSPDLFYRVFQQENGFEIRDILLEKHPFPGSELSAKTMMFSVVDPSFVKTRVGLVSRSPVMLMVHATRTEIRSVFANFPIQSDYRSIYDGNMDNAHGRRVTISVHAFLKELAGKLLPLPFKNYINGRRQLRLYSFSNKRFYKRQHSF